jgi:hypothetical protein
MRMLLDTSLKYVCVCVCVCVCVYIYFENCDQWANHKFIGEIYFTEDV